MILFHGDLNSFSPTKNMTIELSDEEAVLFLAFQKDYATYTTLKESGVFDIRNGKAILNFDQDGTLCEIDCNLKLYKRGVPVIIQLHR